MWPHTYGSYELVNKKKINGKGKQIIFPLELGYVYRLGT